MVKKCRLHYKTHHHRIYVGCYVDDVDDDDNVIGKSHIIGEEEAEPLGEYKTNIDGFVPLFMEKQQAYHDWLGSMGKTSGFTELYQFQGYQHRSHFNKNCESTRKLVSS